jgi:hypothetical protein
MGAEESRVSDVPAPYYPGLPFDATDPIACVAWLWRWARPAPSPVPWWVPRGDGPPAVDLARLPFAEWELEILRRLRTGIEQAAS